MAHSDFPSWQVARPFLKHLLWLHGDGQTVLDLVLRVVHDRACLLAELPDSVLPRLTGNRPTVFLSAIQEAVRNARISVGISSDPRRFLPQTAFVLLLHKEVEWNDVVRFSKPKNFSWTEVVAAKGPTSADAIGVALEEIYEPSHRSRLLLENYSFEERCIHSDCRHLTLRIDIPSGGKEPPSWDGPPRARILLSRESQKHSSVQDFDPLLWRFPSHLAIEHGIRIMCSSILKS